jgi:hypothetical protein
MASPTSQSLQELIAAAGHFASPRIEEFARLASGVQLQRHRVGASDTTYVTRSAALWTLMALDPEIKLALERSGIDYEQLGVVLSLRSAPAPSDVAELHEDFARATQEYLSQLSGPRTVDLPDLALAILRAGKDDPRGLLPGRLRELKVDLDVAMAAIGRLTGPTDAPQAPLDDQQYSASIRQVRRALGGATSVTPGQIAEALQVAHPGYGGGKFERVTLRPDAGPTAVTDDWFQRVRSLYDTSKVAETRHRVIDGELTLLGLAELDPSLAEDLGADGFLDALRSDVEALPRPVTDDANLAVAAIVKAGYLTDAVGEAVVKDEIGVEADVDALARVMIDRDVRPPLSIGLFGDWGSGKSYFMRLMYQRVEQLAARSARVADGRGSYCADVRQITFNAWHYADDNLWASLLAQIFQGLGKRSAVSKITQKLVEGGDTPLGGVLNYMGDRRRQAETQLAEGERERKEAQASLDALEPALRPTSPALRTLAAADAAADPAIADAKAQITQSFGPHAEAQAQQADDASTAVGKLAHDLRVLWSLLQGGGGPRRRAAIAGGLALLALVLGLAVLTIVKPAWVAGFVPAVLAAGAVVRVFARGARAAVSDEAGAAARRAAAQAEAERQAAEDKINKARAEIEAVDTGRATGDYLADRAAEFRSRQGLVALIREELEQLGTVLPSAEGGAERVVLYIDDLDRCGTRRVVQVLEAVHLLLAFPLFVVVVGVDARWLLSSLKHHYRTQFSGELAAATPQQYLEKIFQIPFAIRPIDSDGFGRLMKSMLPLQVTEDGSQRDTSEGEPSPEPDTDRPTAESSDSSPTEESHDQQRDGDTDPADDVPDDDVIGEALRVTQVELDFASALQPVVRSPRAAKRLVNLYRIVRTSSATAGDAERAESDHRNILVLLALLVAAPADAVTVFSAVRASNDVNRLSALIERVRKPPKRPNDDDVLGCLKRLIEDDPQLDELAPYRHWLPSVARFSFDVALRG